MYANLTLGTNSLQFLNNCNMKIYWEMKHKAKLKKIKNI